MKIGYANNMKFLCLGEIVGKSGIFVIKKLLPQLKSEKKIDLVIANGEGATSGFGLGKNHAVYLHKLGIDIITIGDKGFFKKDLVPFIKKASFLLRPLNYPSETPGRFWKNMEIAGKRVTFICAMGLSGFNRVHLNNPYTFLPQLINKLREQTDIFIVEIHSCTTAEKSTLLHLLKGTVSVIYGTQTKALSADLQILNKTGFISDVGRCGSIQSVGGFEPSIEIQKIMTAMPQRSKCSIEGLELQGAIFTVDEETAECVETELIRIPLSEPMNDEELQDNNED